ncbi:MAG: winged helix-turn-helix domain-containing tetratricopeptide repeat protein [Devosia sp.]
MLNFVSIRPSILDGPKIADGVREVVEGTPKTIELRPKLPKRIKAGIKPGMTEGRLSFGPFVLDPAVGTLLRQGVPVPLGYRTLLLLKLLAARPGEVVSKSSLMEAGWPGIVVEEGNLSVQVAALRRALGQREDGSEWIVNIPRLGYRLATSPGPAQPNAPASPAELGPSIVVLPFVSLSDDPEQAFFADGLTEDLITRLARLRWLFVISRNSAFSYKGRSVQPGQVGRELRVRYVLEGSVRRSGSRLRITSRLSDAVRDVQVWAQNHDVELSEFFALQDQISEAVIGAIEPRLYDAEHERFRSQPPDSLDAWGFVMKAMPHVWTWGAPDEIASAQALLQKAIAVDPKYPRANSLLAWTYAAQVQLGLAAADPTLGTAIAIAEQAVQQAPEDPFAHLSAGYALMVARKTNAALAALQEAVDINPSFSLAHMILGSTYGYAGMADEGLHHLALAERMSPRDFSQSAIYSTQATCHFVAGRYGEAVEGGRRAVQLRPHFGTAWRTLAASSGMAGELDGGREALAQARRLHGALSVDWVRRFHPITHAPSLEKYLEGLVAVGLS